MTTVHCHIPRRGDEGSRGDVSSGVRPEQKTSGSGTCRSHLLRVRVLHSYKYCTVRVQYCGGATLPSLRHEDSRATKSPALRTMQARGGGRRSLEHVHTHIRWSEDPQPHPSPWRWKQPPAQPQPQSQQSQPQPHSLASAAWFPLIIAQSL